MNCPDNNTLSEFIEGKMFDEKYSDIFVHIATCPKCRDYCKFVIDAIIRDIKGVTNSLSIKAKSDILKKIEEFSKSDINLKIKKSWNDFIDYISELFLKLESAEVVATSDTYAVITFSSDSQNSEKYQWEMNLFIPVQLEKYLKIEIETNNNKNVSGTLIFCGNEIQIKNGKGQILYEKLKSSFNNPDVAFVFENGIKINGYPNL